MPTPPTAFLLRLALLSGLAGPPFASAREDFDAPATRCADSETVAIWTSPLQALPGQPLKVMAVLTDGPAEGLVAKGPDGAALPLDTTPRGGPPWSLAADFEPPRSGRYRIEVRRGGSAVACRVVAVGRTAEGSGEPTEGEWDTPAEAFYAAWIETLFDAPVSETLSFPSLEPVMRDPRRNFLHDHFGRGEDARLRADPDCADLPYFLRAYFAWKVGLPVSFRACDRGTAARPPQCGAPVIDDRFTRGPQPASAFAGLMSQIANTVHSGSGRTGLGADATDFYPVPLERKYLWPGTLYADPYGHTLLLVKWVPQRGGQSGVLLAADAQPDNSVARKRFWEGNFLFAAVKSAGPGFKTFRPLRRDEGGALRLPSNAALARSAPVAPWSDDQANLAPEDFYARMNQLINPKGLAPEQAYEAMLDALVEQLQTRAASVETGESYMRQHRGTVIPMPSGAAIFETLGPWEDYATPSRDLRVLIAMKVIARLPERIVRYPDMFSLGGRSAEEAKADIEALHAQRLQERRFSYTRSDASAYELSVADAFARKAALEVGYNPNDCAEARWGAQPGTAEYAPCARHAPPDQRARMEQYRPWFHEARRPTR